MFRRFLRSLLMALFAIVFATASLGHAAIMAVPELPAAMIDCHGMLSDDGGTHHDGGHDGSAGTTGAMPFGCPFASLPPLPAVPVASESREATTAAFLPAMVPWPHSADRGRLDRPPRPLS